MKNLQFLYFIRNSDFKYHQKSLECIIIVFTITDQTGTHIIVLHTHYIRNPHF